MAMPQQCSPPHQLGLWWRGRFWRWPFALREEMPSSPSLGGLQAIHHKFCHWERVRAPRPKCSSPLQATLHQPDVKCGVLHELGTVTTSQIACKSLNQNMRTSMQRHERCIWTSSSRNFPQKCSLQCSVGTESAQHRNTNTPRCGPLLRPHHYLNIRAALLKISNSMMHYPCAATRTHD